MLTHKQIKIVAFLAALLLHVFLFFLLVVYSRNLSSNIKTPNISAKPAINLYFYSPKHDAFRSRKIQRKIKIEHSSLESSNNHVVTKKHYKTSHPVADVSDENKKINNLLSILHAAIQAHQQYPNDALLMREEGAAIVGFDLAPEGNIQDVRLIKSSGINSIDMAALKAVKNASPVKLNDENIGFLKENSNHFELKIIFNLQ